jgi:hypothetical protein
MKAQNSPIRQDKRTHNVAHDTDVRNIQIQAIDVRASSFNIHANPTLQKSHGGIDVRGPLEQARFICHVLPKNRS